jgi:D-glycerate 3-kinase
MNRVAALIADHALNWRAEGEPLVLGICGPQASGKSTVSAQIAEHMVSIGLNAAVMSLDDLYHGRAKRAELADQIHPLFATRGPPGTHDVVLGCDVIDRIRRGETMQLPRFSKGHDERVPRAQWPVLDGRCDVLLFEGWCVGALPQAEADLIAPANLLEREEDADAIWRRAINTQLAGPTGELFARIDRLVYLCPPGFEIIPEWRWQQEQAMIAGNSPGDAPAAMSKAQIVRFVAHYERITRHLMAEMPGRADLVIHLDAGRQMIAAHAR